MATHEIYHPETASTFAPNCNENEKSVPSAIRPPPSLVDRIANLPNELKHQVIADALCSRRCIFEVFLPEWHLCTDDPYRRALNELYGLQRTDVYRRSDGSRVGHPEHQHVSGDFLVPGATTTPAMLGIRRRCPGAFAVGYADAACEAANFSPACLCSPGASLNKSRKRKR
ncbi:hypothetical protein ACRALDRAFT_1069044 [Sodiomyces alcalophilus JCM 7366]|uniref:uncharacterized protein n=1 Tax=Sodiomyces alcalophilus JCM 7366 TaxID=591952 RepID=UPI0039B3A6F9